MGILDKITDLTNKYNTKGFYFGATEAEGENKSGVQNFQYYFDDYLEVLPQLNNEKFIFTGRKGSGKSAIAKYIKDTSDIEDNSFSDLIRLKDIEIERLIQIEELENFENKEAVIFEWIILVRIIKLILKNDAGKYTAEYDKLNKFIQRNSGVVGIDKFQVVNVTEKKSFEVKFKILEHISPGFSKNFDKHTVKAPFYKLINPLKEVVSKILNFQNNEGIEFWVLFDDLDLNFKENNQKSIDKITELIRISKLFNTEIFKTVKAKVLIFIRDDIKDIIEAHHSDTAKLFTSYEAELNWYNHEQFKIDENKTPLKYFINKRIEQNFIANNIEYNKNNPWNSLFEEDYNAYKKSSFKYIIDFTYYRPRDLILFLKPIGDNEYKYPLKPIIVKKLIKKYLGENIREIKNELSIYFESIEINDIMDVLRKITGKYNPVCYNELVDIIEVFSFKKSSHEIIRILSKYSIIIPKDSFGNLHYNYREENADSVDLKECEFSTHKSIYIFFNQNKI